jgi:hypothetical protein
LASTDAGFGDPATEDLPRSVRPSQPNATPVDPCFTIDDDGAEQQEHPSGNFYR